MAHILIVEDDPSCQEAIASVFTAREHRVTSCSKLDQAMTALAKTNFDLVLLDWGLPDGEGVDLFSWLLSKTDGSAPPPPVLFLTGMIDVDYKIKAFHLGAEDYISKPFDRRELLARVEARLAKAKSKAKPDGEFNHGRLTFDTITQSVVIRSTRGPKRLSLTSVEFRLLLYFATHENQPLARLELIGAVWGTGVHVLDRTIDSHVSHLRKKLKDVPCSIVSVHGRGYKFRQEP